MKNANISINSIQATANSNEFFASFKLVSELKSVLYCDNTKTVVQNAKGECHILTHKALMVELDSWSDNDTDLASKSDAIKDFVNLEVDVLEVKYVDSVYTIHRTELTCKSVYADSIKYALSKYNRISQSFELNIKKDDAGECVCDWTITPVVNKYPENIVDTVITIDLPVVRNNMGLDAVKLNTVKENLRVDIELAIKNGVTLVGGTPHYLCDDGKCAKMFTGGLSTPRNIPENSSILKVTAVSSSAMNNRTLRFVDASHRDDFVRYIGYGMTEQQIIDVVGNHFGPTAKALSRIDMHSSGKPIEGTEFKNCGIYVVKANYFGDGQFVANIKNLPEGGYQVRAYASVGKGMCINSKSAFKSYMKKIKEGTLEVLKVVGNPDNIIAIMGTDSLKVDKDGLLANVAEDTVWYILHTMHKPNASMATAVTVNKFGLYGSMAWAEEYAVKYLTSKIVNEMLVPSTNGAYIKSRFFGLNKKITIEAIDNALSQLKSDMGFDMGGVYAKILMSDGSIIGQTKKSDKTGFKYPVVDIRFMKEGLVLLRRVPDVGISEWVIAWNKPYAYHVDGLMTSATDNAIWLPSDFMGTQIAECMAGADFDGDGAAVYQLYDFTTDSYTQLGRIMACYENHIVTVDMPKPRKKAEITSIEHYLMQTIANDGFIGIGHIVNSFTRMAYMADESLAVYLDGSTKWVRPANLYGTTDSNGNKIDIVDEKFCTEFIQSIIDSDTLRAKVNIDVNDLGAFRFACGKAGRYYSEVEIGFGKTGVHPEQKSLKTFCTFVNNCVKGIKGKGDAKEVAPAVANFRNNGFSITNAIAKAKVEINKIVDSHEINWVSGFDTSADKKGYSEMSHFVGSIGYANRTKEVKAYQYAENHLRTRPESERRLAMNALRDRNTVSKMFVDEFLEEHGYKVTDIPEHVDDGRRVIYISPKNGSLKSSKVELVTRGNHQNVIAAGLDERQKGFYPCNLSPIGCEDGIYNVINVCQFSGGKNGETPMLLFMEKVVAENATEAK